MPEVRLARSRGDHEAVVGNGVMATVRVRRQDEAPVEVKARHLAELYRQVLLTVEDVTRRRGDLPFGEDPGGNLVEQRLEEVVVRAVDQSHVHGRVPQEARREETTKAGPDDDDSV